MLDSTTEMCDYVFVLIINSISKSLYLFNMYLYVLNDNMRIIRVYKVNTYYYQFIFHPL